MRLPIRNAKADHDLIQEFGIGKLRTAGIEIITCMENKLILTRLERGTFEHRTIGTAINIGDSFGNHVVMAIAKAMQLNADSGGRAAFAVSSTWVVSRPMPGLLSHSFVYERSLLPMVGILFMKFCAEPFFKRCKKGRIRTHLGKEGIK